MGRLRDGCYIVFLIFGLGLILSFLYRLPTPLESWVNIAICNSIGAVIVFGIVPKPAYRSVPLNLKVSLAPGLSLIGAAILAAWSSSLLAPGVVAEAEFEGFSSWSIIGAIVWIPAVEEIVFRRGIGVLFARRFGHVLGGYGASLLFAWVHSLPTFSKVLEWDLQIPMGPFLLGLACEFIYRRSGRLSAIIVFHGACNSTAIIFAKVDPRWLDWLKGLYLDG